MVFDSHDRAIVNATIVLAHTLGLQVIAEGVETRQQLQVLKDMGCDAVQGYYYSRPLPVDRLLEYLHELRGGDC
jgi:EAL domain-containing protein (putative c-di-GMP-specific phosphodiesterase class I)